MARRTATFIVLTFLTAAVVAAQSSSQTDKADALSAAARRGDAAAVKQLLDEGVDVNTKYRYGVTALTYACDHGHVDVVKVLLDRGADVNVKDTFYGFTPLMLAVSPAQKRKPEHAEIVKLLLAKGATGKDEALLSAVSEPDVAMTKVILEAGGFQPDTLSAALESAKHDKQTEIVALLERADAKPFPDVQIDEAQLARYAGTYRSPSGNEITVTLANGKLTAGAGGQSFSLAPSDERTFRAINAPGVKVTFGVEEGKVTGFVINQFGTMLNYTRVEGK